MKHAFRCFALLFFLFSLLVPCSLSAQKIEPGLELQLASVRPDSQVTVIVQMTGQAELAALDNELRRTRAARVERHRRVAAALRQQADLGQRNLRAFLERAKSAGMVSGYQTFWISSLVVVTATPGMIRTIAARDDVAGVFENRVVFLQTEKQKSGREAAALSFSFLAADTKNFNWGLRRINADSLWKLGLTGRGILVGLIDSGVDGNHPALAGKWRGANGATVAESWYDPWKNGKFPVDDDIYNPTHGTHVAGCMVGASGADTVGVAPDAQWIAANAFEINNSVMSGPTDIIISSFQWMADPDGDAGTVDDVPDVLNCSWAFPAGGSYEYCYSIFWDPIDHLEALGVTVILATGNVPPGAPTQDRVGSPANRPGYFAVGAVDSLNLFPSFGTKGPSVCDGVTIKPDVAAPGVSILSAKGGGGYSALNGSSFAAPLVAGVAALLRQYNPELLPDQVTLAIRSSCRDLGAAGPDNSFGYGLVNAKAALALAGTPVAPWFTLVKIQVLAPSDTIIWPGDEVSLVLHLTSLGLSAPSVGAVLASLGADVNVVSAGASYGNISRGEVKANTSSPFRVRFSDQVPFGEKRSFRLTLTSGPTTRQLSFTLLVGADTLAPPAGGVATHDVGRVSFSLTNYGVLGNGLDQEGGFIYPYVNSTGPDHLFHGALLLATAADRVSDATYNDQPQAADVTLDNDFSPVVGGNIRLRQPGIYAAQEIIGGYADKSAKNSLGIEVLQNSYADSAAPDNSYVIVEYSLGTENPSPVQGLYLAQHFEWDVGGGASDDLAGFDRSLALAYMYDNTSGVYVGNCLLTHTVAGFRALDYELDIQNGFTGAEKFASMSSGIGDTLAARTGDWSELLSTGPFSLGAGTPVVAAFAVLGADNLDQLREHARAARKRYGQIAAAKGLDSLPPAVSDLEYVDTVMAQGMYEVRAAAADNFALDGVWLIWRRQGDASFDDTLAMYPTAETGVYRAMVPSQPLGAVVEYYLRAVDLVGRAALAPPEAPQGFGSFVFRPLIAGDSDLNGKVNIFDLLALLRAMAGRLNPTPQQFHLMDTDHNQKIDIFDLLGWLRIFKSPPSGG